MEEDAAESVVTDLTTPMQCQEWTQGKLPCPSNILTHHRQQNKRLKHCMLFQKWRFRISFGTSLASRFMIQFNGQADHCL